AAHRVRQVLFIDDVVGRTCDPSASMPPILCGDFNAYDTWMWRRGGRLVASAWSATIDGSRWTRRPGDVHTEPVVVARVDTRPRFVERQLGTHYSTSAAVAKFRVANEHVVDAARVVVVRHRRSVGVPGHTT